MIERKSPIPPLPWRTRYSPWLHFEAAMLKEVLDTVAAVNSQFLEALVYCARLDNLEFPLPASLREQVAWLTVPQQETVARCGVILADVSLCDITCRGGINDQGRVVHPTEQARHWLPTELSMSLAHCVLLSTWYLVHASPDVARVLLGIDAPGVAAYRELGVHELTRIARTHPHWVRPRWGSHLEAWTGILEGASSTAYSDARSMTVWCLQLSAEAVGISLQLDPPSS
jgi:hypothetical protein